MNNGSFLFLLILNLQDSQTEQVRVVKEMRFNTYLNLQDSQTCLLCRTPQIRFIRNRRKTLHGVEQKGLASSLFVIIAYRQKFLQKL